MDIDRFMFEQGLTALPPGLQDACRRILAMSRTLGNVVVHANPRSRTINLASGQDRTGEFLVDCPTLVYGLSAVHESDSPADRANQCSLTIENNGRKIIGDGTEGLSLEALENVDDHWPLYPPVLVNPGAPLKLRIKCGTVAGTARGTINFHAITFLNLDATAGNVG